MYLYDRGNKAIFMILRDCKNNSPNKSPSIADGHRLLTDVAFTYSVANCYPYFITNFFERMDDAISI